MVASPQLVAFPQLFPVPVKAIGPARIFAPYSRTTRFPGGRMLLFVIGVLVGAIVEFAFAPLARVIVSALDR